ncbi:MAG: hypothetical protein WDN24_16580 [Sphingomonas sp.]
MGGRAHGAVAVIDVRAIGGLRSVVRASGVAAQHRAEGDHLLGPGQAFHQIDDLGDVDALDLRGVAEIGDGGRLFDQHEAVAVERERVRDRTDVLDRHQPRVARPIGFGAIGGIEHGRLAAHDIVDLGPHRRRVSLAPIAFLALAPLLAARPLRL